MKETIRRTIFTLIGASWYAFLFWRTDFGINTLLFIIPVLAGLFFLRRDLISNWSVIASAGAVLLSAILVVIHNSVIAKAVHQLAIVLLIGFVQSRELRFIAFAAILGISSIFEGPIQLIRQFEKEVIKSPHLKQLLYWLRMVILPVILGFLFLGIYSVASDKFAWLLTESWGRFLGRMLSFLEPDRIIIWGIGFMLCAALLTRSYFFDLLCPKGHPYRLTMRRKRKAATRLRLSLGTLSLKHEYRRALLTFALLNGLLLIFNITDLRYIWIEYEDVGPHELSQYVHEGTWLLLFSIALAMAIILYFFRKNLNFYPDNDLLKTLVGIWIFQNLILTLSVGMRNVHYVSSYGLAYKRIAVFFFLLLVCFALWTIQQKVFARRTTYFFFQSNGWAVFALLLLASSINWDVVITRYNLYADTRYHIDVNYLIDEISDQNLHLLYANKDRLLGRSNLSPITLDTRLNQKRSRFEKKQARKNWRAWNWADMQNNHKIQKNTSSTK